MLPREVTILILLRLMMTFLSISVTADFGY